MKRPRLAFFFLFSFIASVSITGCTKHPDTRNKDTQRSASATTNAQADTNDAASKHAQDAQRAKKARQTVTDVPAASNALQEFGGALFEQLQHAASKDKNLAVSPWSIESALVMAAAGAKTDTLAQMLYVLGFARFADNPQSMQTSLAALSDTLLKAATSGDGDDASSILQAANSLWVAAQLKDDLQPEFEQRVKTIQHAKVHEAPFQTQAEDARKTINAWVSDHTNQKIPDLIPAGAIDASTTLVLVNAIAFDADWEHAFPKQDTQKKDFHLQDGSVQKVDMMQQTLTHAGHWKGQHFKAVDLPYKGGEYAMSIIVPEQGYFGYVRDALFKNGYDTIFPTADAQTRGKVRVHLPRFQFRWSGQLNAALSAMGMGAAFSGQADFSGMFAHGHHQISSVVHEVYINVDETGTEAAAATGGMIQATAARPTSEPFVVRADRPFLFAIRETKTNTPLFLGQVMNPAP